MQLQGGRLHEMALVYAGNRLPALEIKSDRPVYRGQGCCLSDSKDLIRRDGEVQGGLGVSGGGMASIVPPRRAGQGSVSKKDALRRDARSQLVAHSLGVQVDIL